MPNSRAALLADIVTSSKQLVARYLAGFNDATHVRQVPDLPNHVAWCLGHMAGTMNRLAAKIDGQPEYPPEYFITADGRGSRDKGHFDTTTIIFGSSPEERHDRFPTLAKCTEIFNVSVDRLASAVAKLDDAQLEAPTRWMSGELPLWQLVSRMVFHNGFHTGQIADMRRALAFKSVF